MSKNSDQHAIYEGAPAESKPIPATGRALLDLLTANEDAIDYHDPRVTTSGLTALRHRGLARVEGKRIVMVKGKEGTT